jgi:hypothetical protein
LPLYPDGHIVWPGDHLMKRLTLVFALLCVPPAMAAEVTDATGRTVQYNRSIITS